MTAAETPDRHPSRDNRVESGRVPAVQRNWLAIWNPAAGVGPARKWRSFERALTRSGLHLDVVRTSAPDDATRIATQAVASGVYQILVAGGDGSVHEVVNGVMHASAPDSPDPRRTVPLVVPVPLGTGNDWSRSLALPPDPERFARVVAERHRVGWHDVGRMSFDAAPFEPRWFVNVAGAGLDAHVIAGMPARVPSRLAYLVHALRQLRGYHSPWLRLHHDAGDGAGELRDGRFLLAFAAIGRYCGHRMHVAPAARPDDGLIDVVTIDDMSLWRVLPRLVELYDGTLLEDPMVGHRRSRTLRIESESAVPVEADGQLAGHTPVTFSLETRALRVLHAAPS